MFEQMITSAKRNSSTLLFSIRLSTNQQISICKRICISGKRNSKGVLFPSYRFCMALKAIILNTTILFIKGTHHLFIPK